MITKEKYILLKSWGEHAVAFVGVNEMSYIVGSMAGFIVGELPANHRLFSLPHLEAMLLLDEMAIEKLVALRDSL